MIKWFKVNKESKYRKKNSKPELINQNPQAPL